jgi:2,3-bisphosphoglycerate-independent phosphoglycerate mutase
VGGYRESLEPAPAGYSALDGWTDEASGYCFEVFPLAGGEEAILCIRQGGAADPPSGQVTDSDPFFFTDLPVLRPRPLASARRPEAAARTADALNRFLLEAAGTFDSGPSKTGPGTLLVSKWTGTFVLLPPFAGLTGTVGASVASTGLFRGLARLIGLEFFHEPDGVLCARASPGNTSCPAARRRSSDGFSSRIPPGFGGVLLRILPRSSSRCRR